MADLNLRIDRDAYQPPERPERKVVQESKTPDAMDLFLEEFAEEIVGEKREPVREVRQPRQVRQQRRVQPEPQPVLQEEVFVPAQPQRQQNYIDRSADRLSNFLGDTGKTVQINEMEQRFGLLEAEISKIRQMTKAHFPGDQGNTIVSGIGQGGDGQTPGSGAVWLWDLDDVDIGTPMNGVYPDITDGSVLVYDAATDKWKPGDGGGPGEHESNLQTGGVIQKDGGAVNNTGELIIKQDANGDGGDIKFENSSGATFISLYASSGRIANIHRLSDTPSLELGQCGPSGSRKSVILLENGAPTGTNTAPRLTLLNTSTQTPGNDDDGNTRYNLTIAAGTQTNMRIERGTNNGGWTSLYMEGKTTNYDSTAAGDNSNPNNDPKKYPLINVFRSNDTSSGHLADVINYRGRTDTGFSLQTKTSVQDLINAGGGGVGFEFSGVVNVTLATDSGSQPSHSGDLTDPTEGAFYINDTAGVADSSWTGIAGLTISKDQLIIWSEQAQRWFAGAVEDNTSFLKINGTNNMVECLNVVLNTPPEGGSNAAITVRKQGDSEAKTTIYAGGSMDVGGSIKCTANIIPATANTGNVGASDNRFAEVNAVKINTSQNSVMAGINTTYNGAYNLGEVDTRWGTVYAQAVNCDSTSTMANINPVTANSGDIGSTSKRWNNVNCRNINSNLVATLSSVNLSGDILPSTTASSALGSSTKRFATAYINAIETQNQSVMAQIIPKNTSNDFGASNTRWNTGYFTSISTNNKSTMNAIWPQNDGGQSLGATGTRWNTLFANSVNLSGGSFTNTGTMSQTGDATMSRLTVNTQAQFNIAVKTTKNFEATGTTSKLQFTAASAAGEIDVSGQKNKKLYFYCTDDSGGSGALYRVAIFAYEECDFSVPLKVNNVRYTNLTGLSQLKGDVEVGTMAMFNGLMYYYGLSGGTPRWFALNTVNLNPPA